jgi:hypothetical protein
MMWDLPEVQAFVKHHSITKVYLDMCQYGSPHMKPTTFISNDTRFLALSER